MDLRRIRRPVKAEGKKPRFGGAFYLQETARTKVCRDKRVYGRRLDYSILTDIRTDVSLA